MDAGVLKVLTHQPQLCTLYDLRTKYCFSDFLDFIEIIDTLEAVNRDGVDRVLRERNRNKGKTKNG